MTGLLTVKEAAQRLRCRRETIRRYIASGQLPALRTPGGYLRIREQDLAACLTPAKVRGSEVSA